MLDIEIRAKQVRMVNTTDKTTLKMYEISNMSDSLIHCTIKRTMWIYFKLVNDK